MATEPQFASTPNYGTGSITAANTARDGTGSNIVTCFTAGASGSKVNEIRLKATGQTAAGFVTLFVHDGTNFRILTEIAVTAITPSTTVASYESTPIRFPDLDLPTGFTIRAGITVVPVSGTMMVHVEGGNF
jgi:hypothetical protein